MDHSSPLSDGVMSHFTAGRVTNVSDICCRDKFGVADVKGTDSGKSHYIVHFSRGVHNR